MEEKGLSVADALALRGGGNNNANDVWGGNNAWWIIILILFFAFGGGWGNRNNGNHEGQDRTVVIPSNAFGGYNACCTPATQQGLTDAFNFNQLDNGQRGLERGLCDGFYSTNLAITNLGANMQQGFCSSDRANLQSFNNVQSALCQGFNHMASEIAQTNYNMKDCCCETRESIIQSNFNNQSGFNAVQNQLASCCCDLGRGQENIKYAIAQATCDINANADKNADRIINHMVQNEMDNLRTELQSAQFQLSQNSQTNNIINQLRPTPVPAWPVQSPYTSLYGSNNFGYNTNCNTCC